MRVKLEPSPLPRIGSAERRLRAVLESADVRVDGRRAWDPQIHDSRTLARVLRGGSLALGESYVDGWWDCEALDELFHRLHTAAVRLSDPLPAWVRRTRDLAFTRRTRRRARSAAQAAYEIGDDFYAAWLDPRMQYTCAYFEDGDDLARAQERKLELICRKLRLGADDHVLDLGCGWGGFPRYAAERHGCRVTGVTIVGTQAEWARAHCAGLPVEILVSDYRDVQGSFDKVLVCGMLEHVGREHYRRLMETVHRSLRPGGLFLLQTIGSNHSQTGGEPWYTTYIFPRGMLPSAAQITHAAEGLFTLEDWHALGSHYDRTLLAWSRNFEASWPRFRDRYGDRFGRMWRYYLLSCAGGFRARVTHLWQVLLGKGVPSNMPHRR